MSTDKGMLYFNDDVIKKHYERAKETVLTVADGYFVSKVETSVASPPEF